MPGKDLKKCAKLLNQMLDKEKGGNVVAGSVRNGIPGSKLHRANPKPKTTLSTARRKKACKPLGKANTGCALSNKENAIDDFVEDGSVDLASNPPVSITKVPKDDIREIPLRPAILHEPMAKTVLNDAAADRFDSNRLSAGTRQAETCISGVPFNMRLASSTPLATPSKLTPTTVTVSTTEVAHKPDYMQLLLQPARDRELVDHASHNTQTGISGNYPGINHTRQSDVRAPNPVYTGSVRNMCSLSKQDDYVTEKTSRYNDDMQWNNALNSFEYIKRINPASQTPQGPQLREGRMTFMPHPFKDRINTGQNTFPTRDQIPLDAKQQHPVGANYSLYSNPLTLDICPGDHHYPGSDLLGSYHGGNLPDKSAYSPQVHIDVAPEPKTYIEQARPISPYIPNYSKTTQDVGTSYAPIYGQATDRQDIALPGLDFKESQRLHLIDSGTNHIIHHDVQTDGFRSIPETKLSKAEENREKVIATKKKVITSTGTSLRNVKTSAKTRSENTQTEAPYSNRRIKSQMKSHTDTRRRKRQTEKSTKPKRAIKVKSTGVQVNTEHVNKPSVNIAVVKEHPTDTINHGYDGSIPSKSRDMTNDQLVKNCERDLEVVDPVCKQLNSKSHLQTLTYLVRELRAATSMKQSDQEIGRLAREIQETVVDLIPGSGALAWHTELDLAVQPLRSDNAQLRRKVRILGQQLRAKEMAVDCGEKPNPCFEVMHLKLMNNQLDDDLQEERSRNEVLTQQVKLVKQELDALAATKKDLLEVLNKKDTDHLRSQQDMLSDIQQLRSEIEHGQRYTQDVQKEAEESKAQRELLKLTVQEKDKEIENLHNLVRNLQGSMTRLLLDLQNGRPESLMTARRISGELKKLQHNLSSDHSRVDNEASMVEQTVRPSTSPETQQAKQSPAKRQLQFHRRVLPGTRDPPLAQVRYQSLFPETRDPPPAGLRTSTVCDMDSTDYLLAPGASPIHGGPKTLPEKQIRSVNKQTLSKPEITFGKLQETLLEKGNLTVKDVLAPLADQMLSQFKRASASSLPASDTTDIVMHASPRTISNEMVNTPLDTRGQDSSSWTTSDHDGTLRAENTAEETENASGYSVTDYFNKYPQYKNKPIWTEDDKTTLLTESAADSMDRNAIDTQNGRHSAADGRLCNELSIQDSLYRGTDLDTNLSAVSDVESFPSMTSLGSANTVDDLAFREGLATLDANIARVQQTLRQAMYK